MPYDSNNMFGVLADPETMSKLKSRGRSKQFEKEMAEEMAREQEEEAEQIARAIKVHEEIAKEVEEILRASKETQLDRDGSATAGDDEANEDEAADPQTPAKPTLNNSFIDPFSNLDFDFDDNLGTDANTTPRPSRSGKPSHRRRRDLSARPSTPTPTPGPPALALPHPSTTQPPTSQPQTRETFIFPSSKDYATARALFALKSQPEHASQLRWKAVVGLLSGRVVGCEVFPGRAGGVEWKVVRPRRVAVGSAVGIAATDAGSQARRTGWAQERQGAEDGGRGEQQETGGAGEEDAGDGGRAGEDRNRGEGGDNRLAEMQEDGTKEEIWLPRRSVVLHAPHGGTEAWVQRHMLDHIAEALCGKFGWERGDFIRG